MRQIIFKIVNAFLFLSVSAFGQTTDFSVTDLDDAYMNEIKFENTELSNRIKSFPLAVQNKNKEAGQAIRDKNYERAVLVAMQLDSIYPENPDIKNFKGKMLIKMGNSSGAIKSFDEAIKLNPKNKWFYINKASVEADNNQKEQALQTIEKLNSLFPKWSIGYNFKAALLHALGKNKEALTAYGLAMGYEPLSALIATNRGDLYLLLKDTEKAIKDYKKALAIQPGYTRAKLKLDSISN